MKKICTLAVLTIALLPSSAMGETYVSDYDGEVFTETGEEMLYDVLLPATAGKMHYSIKQDGHYATKQTTETGHVYTSVMYAWQGAKHPVPGFGGVDTPAGDPPCDYFKTGKNKLGIAKHSGASCSESISAVKAFSSRGKKKGWRCNKNGRNIFCRSGKKAVRTKPVTTREWGSYTEASRGLYVCGQYHSYIAYHQVLVADPESCNASSGIADRANQALTIDILGEPQMPYPDYCSVLVPGSWKCDDGTGCVVITTGLSSLWDSLGLKRVSANGGVWAVPTGSNPCQS